MPRWGTLDPDQDSASMMPGGNRANSLAEGPAILGWSAMARGLAGESMQPGGNNDNTDESTESPISADVEAELREEAKEVYRELVREGLPPMQAWMFIKCSVYRFVWDFKSDRPLAGKGQRLDRDVSARIGMHLPDGGFRRMQAQNIRAGRPPGGLYAWSMGAWGPRRSSDRRGRPITRGECKAVDNIMGDSRMSELHDMTESVKDRDGRIQPGVLRPFLEMRNGSPLGGMQPFGSMRNYPTPEWARRRGWGRLR